VARLAIGGKYNNQIVFQGNKKYLPATVRGVINSYFNRWNSLKDVATYAGLYEELSQLNAGRYFKDTDWAELEQFYRGHLERYSVVIDGATDPKRGVVFTVRSPADKPARPVYGVIQDYCDREGVLRDSFDLWAVEKLLRRNKGQVRFGENFGPALRRWGATAISIEESLSFYRQVQAYHARDFLTADLQRILAPAIDAVHTIKNPLEIDELSTRLRDAGAELRVRDSVRPIIEHAQRIADLARPAEAANGVPAVAKVIEPVLKPTLYDFQREGAAFLVANGRALLADDMGLGKTVQAIAAALYLKHQQGLRRVLIVCPASLKYQWQAEIQRFTGERCEVIGGTAKDREDIYRAASVSGGFIAPEDRPFFYVINYELVYRDIEQLQELGADLLVLDEAQRVKNFRTKTAQAVFELPAKHMFVLTGTPLENQLMELYTIMSFIDRQALGTNPVAFRDRYVVTDRFGGIAGYRLVEEVTRKIASLTLRRTKQQTLSQLPPLVENDRWLDLTDTQRKIYKELQGQAREVLSESVWDAAQANNALTLVQRLREVCDTPELLDPEQTSSPKLTELMDIITDEVGALDRQVIVFTQWTRMGEIIMRELQERDFSGVFLHGGVKAQERQQMVERFNAGEERVFVSTDAGGTGLNLQSASLVVNYDLPFNPAKLAQRVARAHRIGQENTVMVVNLLCFGTVEHRLVKILREKQELFDDVFGDIPDPGDLSPKKAAQRNLREFLGELVE
jgi:SNF2 family DNA or RNA helicase